MARPKSDVSPRDVVEKGDRADIVSLLNEAIALEYSAAIQFVTWASLVEGLDGEPVRERLTKMAPGELEHARLLLDRLWALGGTPTLEVGETKLVGSEPEKILDGAIAVEESAIAHYRKIFGSINRRSMVLWETIEEILEDEEEELEDLRRLRGR